MTGTKSCSKLVAELEPGLLTPRPVEFSGSTHMPKCALDRRHFRKGHWLGEVSEGDTGWG